MGSKKAVKLWNTGTAIGACLEHCADGLSTAQFLGADRVNDQSLADIEAGTDRIAPIRLTIRRTTSKQPAALDPRRGSR